MLKLIEKVKKPVEIIQCANSFSLVQRKMYNVLLANAAGRFHQTKTHRISIRFLCNFMGYHSKDYKNIKNQFRALRRMDIEWDIVNENGNTVWTNTSPLSLARVIEGEGICEYEFTPSLIPYLDRPAQYAKFNLSTQAKFKSIYGLVLYENCERYKNIGLSKTFDIQTFRKLMGVIESEYTKFFAFKQRVITFAIKEVNKYSDLEVEAKYEKNGRCVVAIQFSIKNKQFPDHSIDFNLPFSEQKTSSQKTVELNLSTIDGSTNHLVETLKTEFGITQENIDRYLKTYGKDYVSAKVCIILNSDGFKKGIIRNMAAYLKKALFEDFQEEVNSKQNFEKVQRNDKVDMDDETIKRFKMAYENYLSKEVARVILEINEDVRIVVLKNFEQYLGSGVYFETFKRDGLSNPIIADRFVIFLRFRHTDILNMAMSFDDYIKENAELECESL